MEAQRETHPPFMHTHTFALTPRSHGQGREREKQASHTDAEGGGSLLARPKPQPHVVTPGPPPHLSLAQASRPEDDLMGRWSGLQLSRKDPASAPKCPRPIKTERLKAGRGLRIPLIQPPSSSNVGIPSATFLTHTYTRLACIPVDGELTTFKAEGGILRS